MSIRGGADSLSVRQLGNGALRARSPDDVTCRFKVADPRVKHPEGDPMEIQRRKSTGKPDPYSISDVRVIFPGTGTVEGQERTVGTLHLLVDLEPKASFRERGFGPSYEAKQNACTLRIEKKELERIQETLRQELQKAYQFLMDQKLLAEFERYKEQGRPPAANLPDKKLGAGP
jgi:hypothetical protein